MSDLPEPDRPNQDVEGNSEWGNNPNDSFAYMPPAERDTLAQFLGEDWRQHITIEGANRFFETVRYREQQNPDPVHNGDPCPMCGEPIRDSSQVMPKFGGESLAAEKVCVYESGENCIIHFDDDRIDAIEQDETKSQ
jgi:hypothetical protein